MLANIARRPFKAESRTLRFLQARQSSCQVTASLNSATWIGHSWRQMCWGLRAETRLQQLSACEGPRCIRTPCPTPALICAPPYDGCSVAVATGRLVAVVIAFPLLAGSFPHQDEAVCPPLLPRRPCFLPGFCHDCASARLLAFRLH